MGILDGKASKEKKADALMVILEEMKVEGRKELASDLRNLLQVKEDKNDPWPE